MPNIFLWHCDDPLFSIIQKRLAGLMCPGLSESVRGYTIPILGAVEAGSFKDRSLPLLLPTAVLTIVNISFYSRFVRASMLEGSGRITSVLPAKGLMKGWLFLNMSLRML